MNFHEVRFPAAISLGASGGPERKTDIVTLNNGFEERNAVWAHSRRRYDAGVGVASLDDLAAVISFFEARMGRLYGFRWKDWADYKSCAGSAQIGPLDQVIGTGDGTSTKFNLQKAYTSGSETYWRPIKKAVESTVLVAVADIPQTHGTDYVFDATIGEITFVTAPLAGETVSAGFEFDVPVRFDSDSIETNISSFNAGAIPDVPVVEVRV